MHLAYGGYGALAVKEMAPIEENPKEGSWVSPGTRAAAVGHGDGAAEPGEGGDLWGNGRCSRVLQLGISTSRLSAGATAAPH